MSYNLLTFREKKSILKFIYYYYYYYYYTLYTEMLFKAGKIYCSALLYWVAILYKPVFSTDAGNVVFKKNNGLKNKVKMFGYH